MLESIVLSLLIPLLVYLAISAGLIAFGKPKKTGQAEAGPGIDFSRLAGDYSGLPELEPYAARDGSKLRVRHYAAESSLTMILIHGSGWHSSYLLPLAGFIAESGLARVYTPDLRGHGQNPARRGDVDHVGQLEDDLADLVGFIKEKHPETKVIIAGHSSGGGLALRFAGGKYGGLSCGCLLLSPFLKYNAPTMRPNSGGWAIPYVGRIIGLVLLNNLGLTWFNHLPVIEFNLPSQWRDGSETLVYSYQLNAAMAPVNYKRDLAAIKAPLLVMVGEADESFIATEFPPLIKGYAPNAQVEIIPAAGHIEVVTGEKVRPILGQWLKESFPDPGRFQ